MKYTILFCLLLIKTSSLYSQRPYMDQHKLRADQQVKACRMYKQVFRNRQPTADSVLSLEHQYNSKGYVAVHTWYDPPGDAPLRYEHEYLHDTLEIKVTGYKSNNEAYSWNEHRYDAWGKRVESVHSSTARRDGKKQTFRNYMEYDSLHRSTAVYFDNGLGGGKKLLSRFGYDPEGREERVYFYGMSAKKPVVSEIEYDAQGRIVRHYKVKKGKRKLTATRTYNEKGQWVSHSTDVDKTQQKHFGVISYRTKKTDRIRTDYTYDEKGLLQKEERYENEKLVSRYWYIYSR